LDHSPCPEFSSIHLFFDRKLHTPDRDADSAGGGWRGISSRVFGGVIIRERTKTRE